MNAKWLTSGSMSRPLSGITTRMPSPSPCSADTPGSGRASPGTSSGSVAGQLVLPGQTVARLEAAPLARVIGTDTHPNHRLVEGRPRFVVVSVADLFADVVARLAD